MNTKLTAGAAAVIAFASPNLAMADEATEARIKALEEQLAVLQAQLADLKASTASNATAKPVETTGATVSIPNARASVSIPNGRPTISSSDGAFTASIRAVFQLDTAHYEQDPAGPLGSDFRRGSYGDPGENDHARDLSDGADFRRARLGVEGKAFGAFDYHFLYDFGGSGTEEEGRISAAWVQYNFPVSYNLKLRLGAFSPPGGLEEAVSTNGSLFAERASPAETVRAIAGGDGRTAVGLMANGPRWTASAAVTGNVVGTSTFDEQTAFVGRLSFVPFQRPDALLHLGANTTVVFDPAASGPEVDGLAVTNIRLRDRPEMRVDGTRLVDTGNIDANGLVAFGAEVGALWKSFYLQSEYFDVRVDRKGAFRNPDFSGWYAQLGWMLTGESRRYSTGNATFDAARPDKPFDPAKGEWGAWELGLRYSRLDLDFLAGAPGTAPDPSAIRGGQQEIFTLGLNWYLNSVLRFQAAYQDVSVDRLSPGGTAFGAGAATPPAGAQVGQDFQIYSFRTQYAF